MSIIETSGETCPACGGVNLARDSDSYIFCYQCDMVVASLRSPTGYTPGIACEWYPRGSTCRMEPRRDGVVQVPRLMASHGRASPLQRHPWLSGIKTHLHLTATQPSSQTDIPPDGGKAGSATSRRHE